MRSLFAVALMLLPGLCRGATMYAGPGAPPPPLPPIVAGPGPAPLGFGPIVDAATGHIYSGTVLTGAANCNVPGAVAAVCLSDFTVRLPAGAAGGPYNFVFSETFALPAGNYDAIDRISGEFFSLNAATALATTMAFRGYVNGVAIAPPGIAVAAVASGLNPDPFGPLGHGAMGVAGALFTLEGRLRVNLVPGDGMRILGSDRAVVALFPAPEPGALGLTLLGMAGVILLGRRWKRESSKG